MLLVVGVAGVGRAESEVRLPNGEVRETVRDLQVKVAGGFLTVERVWQADSLNKGEYRWYVNPAWADLVFEFDSLDGSVKSVRRAESTFERSGNDIYVYDRTYFIARRADASGATTGWRWYDRNGNRIDYDADGKILSYGNRNDIGVTFTRNGPGGRIDTIRDRLGVVAMRFEYDASGSRVDAVVDRSQRRVEYTYTGDALTSVLDAAGQRWSYAYTSGLLTGKTDPESRVTQIVYAGNRVVKIVDPMSFETTWDYAFDRGKRQYAVVEKSAEGTRTETRYDADGELLRQVDGTRTVNETRRDGANVEIVKDESGGTTRTEYDARRNPVKTVFPDGSVATTTYDGVHNLPIDRIDELGVTTHHAYDAKGNLATLVEAQGTAAQRTTTYVYDAFGRMTGRSVVGAAQEAGATTSWTYDDYDNVVGETNAEQETTGTTYDVAGNVLTRTDARGKTWTYTRDPRGLVTTSKDPLGNQRSFEYDKVGNLKKIVDEKGKETSYVYDANDRLTTVSFPDGGVISYGYDEDDRVTSFTDQRGATRTFAYDADGRRTTTTEANGTAVVAEYGEAGSSAAGQVKRERHPTYCEDYRYDQRGRTTRIERRTPCDGAAELVEATSIGYDARGQEISRTDPAQGTTLTTRDALGRIARIIDAVGGVTEYTYDARDNRTAVTDANGGTHRFVHDKVDRLLEEVRPSGVVVVYEYDDAGNQVVRRGADGRRHLSTYDDAGRLVAERYFAAGANAPGQSVVFRYDARGLLDGYEQTGDTVSRAVFAYDEVGRRTSESTTYGSGAQAFTRTLAVEYWANGLVKALVYPDQTRIAYDYDASNRPEAASLPGAGEIRWDDYVGRKPKKIVMPGAVGTTEYDAFGRTTRLKAQAIGGGSAQDPAGMVIMDDRLVYDAAGNLAQRTTQDGEYMYAHDAIGRLTSAMPPASVQVPALVDGLFAERYSYDGLHNRKSSEHQPGPWTYGSDNQLVAYGTSSERRRLEHDAEGRIIRVTRGEPALETMELVYNAAGRLGEVKRDGATVGRYGYDPFGRRIRKDDAGGTTWFQYVEQGIAAEYSAAGALTRAYGWPATGEWGTEPLWIADKLSGVWRVGVFRNDQVGTPRYVVDGQGVAVWSALFQAFGAAKVSASSTMVNPLRLPGQYLDAESGLHYNFHRDYDPATGRYVERDPLGLDAGTATFAYADGGPLLSTDPLGLFRRTEYKESDDSRTICHGERLTYEVPPHVKCTRMCRVEHELQHIEDISQVTPDVCVGAKKRKKYPIMPSTFHEQRWTEKRAYTAELKCLNRLKRLCPRGECAKAIEDDITTVNIRLNDI
ncbi:MAG TPA: RHS repeat-associated core domain-containing protein [Tahibacter sp.]|nr:RHS repeat-associated core domain-containing protein [Tahibacter sp.]